MQEVNVAVSSYDDIPFHVDFTIDNYYLPFNFFISRTWLVKYVDKTCTIFLSPLNLYP